MTPADVDNPLAIKSTRVSGPALNRSQLILQMQPLQPRLCYSAATSPQSTVVRDALILLLHIRSEKKKKEIQGLEKRIHGNSKVSFELRCCTHARTHARTHAACQCQMPDASSHACPFSYLPRGFLTASILPRLSQTGSHTPRNWPLPHHTPP